MINLLNRRNRTEDGIERFEDGIERLEDGIERLEDGIERFEYSRFAFFLDSAYTG